MKSQSFDAISWLLIALLFVHKVSCEIPQPFDYVGIGFHLDCYECHSNRPGCGKDIDWILSRWKPCLMPAPKCVKIIERYEGQTFYVRGCLKEIEVTREDIPTVRDNGCWTVDGEYVGWGRNIFVPSDKTLYCFCDERDGCNAAITQSASSKLIIVAVLLINFAIYAFN